MAYTCLVRFEWDKRKAASNKEKHRLSFEQAKALFNEMYIGGHSAEPWRYLLAKVGSSGVSVVSEHPLNEVFSEDTIQNAFEDECCGIDIHHVASLANWGNKLLLALGGGGVELGACQGCGALATVDLSDTLAWNTQILDLNDGISGLQTIGSTVLVDFCGDLRAFEWIVA